MIAALFVHTNGVYFGIPGVDPWDIIRDACKYEGPHPVIAHPPCERWGRYARGGPNPMARRFEIGDDSGCFEHALACVRKFGGVLEHPEGTHAYTRFGIAHPKAGQEWVKADEFGYVCSVDQGNYGHSARKATWLYAVGTKLPELIWTRAKGKTRLELGPRSKEEALRLRALNPPIKRISTRERIDTPIPFRDLLISLVRASD